MCHFKSLKTRPKVIISSGVRSKHAPLVPGRYFPVRVLVGFMIFLGTLTSYVMRVNLNIAIVQMTDDAEGLCTETTDVVINQAQ